MFRRSRPDPAPPAPSSAPASLAPVLVTTPADMALDTLGAVLRSMGEFAIDQEKMDAVAFSALAERWAQHVLVATPAPSSTGAADARRDWGGVRDFVDDYCRGAHGHVRTVTGDLRQVVWVFIQNLNHTFAQDELTDARLREQLSRLEKLAESSTTGELKKEVLATVLSVSQTVEDRRKRQREQMEVLGAQVRSLGTELESARREGETDPLTRLYNRKALDEYLTRSVELYRAFGHETCLLLIDVDRFKGINDTFGHITGDEVLRKVADSVMRVFLRKNDFVARFGGDELAVVLRETKVADTLKLAERLMTAVRAIDIQRADTRLQITTSIGIAPLAPGHEIPDWIEAADKALYRAKQDGRDRAVAI
jgi:diguanylate cyclase (GGDEF)-like protein